MRYCLFVIVALGVSLFLPSQTVAQTRTHLRMPWRQTGLVGERWLPEPLGRHIESSTDITVLQVVAVDARQHVVTFKATTALEGKAPADPVRHQFGDQLSDGERRAFLEWAKPGRFAISFHEDLGGDHVCVGTAWYRLNKSGIVAEVLETATQTYVGSVERLREHVVAILAGKEVVITASAPSQRGPIPRDWLRGEKGRVWRLRASTEITFRWTRSRCWKARNFSPGVVTRLMCRV